MANCIVFTGGGTGGHVFPALAVLAELTKRWQGRVVWIGSTSGIEHRILAGKNIPYYGIPSGKLRRYFSLRNFLDIFKIIGGLVASFFVFLKEKPALIFSKGGYVTVPPVIAAHLLGIPVITHESDLNPGLATKINARFAEKVLISFQATVSFFKPRDRARIIHTGNPVRSELLEGDPEQGRRMVGCPPQTPLLLVLGGSQGARFINNLIQDCIAELTENCFVVHQMGPAHFRDSERIHYYTAPFFTSELPHLLAAADLVICRSGANTLWEIAALGKPALLIPLTYTASRGDQIENAGYFEAEGAAVILYEQDASGNKLIENVLNLLDNKNRLAQMARKALSLGLPEAAARIAELLLERSKRAQGGD